jgi:hypothetical protein
MPDHPTVSRRALLTAVGVGTVAALPLSGAAYADSPPVDTVLEWYELTAAAVGVITGTQQVTNSHTWAIGWIAAWRALSTVEGRRAPEAAVAGAVHDAVAALIPAHAPDLDAALTGTLARLGNSPTVHSGLEAAAARRRRCSPSVPVTGSTSPRSTGRSRLRRRHPVLATDNFCTVRRVCHGNDPSRA